MKGLIKFFKSYLSDEEGQTAVEYILLLFVAAVVILKFKDRMDQEMTGVIDDVFGKVREMLNKG